MLRINPATAWRMLHDFVPLQPGDWIAQNAANSAVGRAVMQIARSIRVRTANIVRRTELVEELKSEGDLILLDDDNAREKITAATGRSGIRLALNSVGGESALRLASSLAFGATVVTYGAMARQPLRIPNGLLIFQDQRWRGFWITKWYEEATAETRAAMFAKLFALAAAGTIHSPIDAIFPLEDVTGAIARAQQSGRAGKVLLRIR